MGRPFQGDAQRVRERHPGLVGLGDVMCCMRPTVRIATCRALSPVDDPGDPQCGGEGFRGPGTSPSRSARSPAPTRRPPRSAALPGPGIRVGTAVQQPRHLPGRDRGPLIPARAIRVSRAASFACCRPVRGPVVPDLGCTPAASWVQRSGGGSRPQGRPLSPPGAHPGTAAAPPPADPASTATAPARWKVCPGADSRADQSQSRWSPSRAISMSSLNPAPPRE